MSTGGCKHGYHPPPNSNNYLLLMAESRVHGMFVAPSTNTPSLSFPTPEKWNYYLYSVDFLSYASPLAILNGYSSSVKDRIHTLSYNKQVLEQKLQVLYNPEDLNMNMLPATELYHISAAALITSPTSTCVDICTMIFSTKKLRPILGKCVHLTQWNISYFIHNDFVAFSIRVSCSMLE